MNTLDINYPIVGIEQNDDDWIFKTSDGDDICLAKALFDKEPKLPFKMLWQKTTLTVGYIVGIPVAAWLDGKELFVLAEKDYPKKAANAVAFAKEWDEKRKARFAFEDEQICKELDKYLEKFVYPTALSSRLSELPILLRAPLKAAFLFGCAQSLASKEFDSENFEKRLFLNFILFHIVAGMYENAVADITYLADLYGILRFQAPWPKDYHTDISLFEQHLTEERCQSAFASYYEIQRALRKELPKVENPLLERYFIYLVQKWLYSYAYALDDFDENAVKAGLFPKRILSDESEYKQQYRNKFLSFDFMSFIFPKISDDDFGYFLLNGSLK